MFPVVVVSRRICRIPPTTQKKNLLAIHVDPVPARVEDHLYLVESRFSMFITSMEITEHGVQER